MFSKLIFAIISFFAFLQVAVALPSPDGGSTTNQCNTGSVQCCNSVQSANNADVQDIFSWLGIPIGSVTGLVGLGCSSVDVAGIGGNSCASQPVCCENNQYNGLVNVGCTSVNVNA